MLKKKKTCKYFVKGFCRYGTNCHNSHDIIKQRDPCRYYEKKGYCNCGTECHFIHHPKLVFKTPIIVAYVTTYYSSGLICSDILLRTKDFINFEESTIGYTFPRFNYHTLFDYRTQTGDVGPKIYEEVLKIKQEYHKIIEKIYLLHVLIPLDELAQIIISLMELCDIKANIEHHYRGGN